MSREKDMNEMTLPDLLEKYQNDKMEFRNYGTNYYFKDYGKDEVTRKRHENAYEELRQNVLITASYIAEKLLK